MKNTEIIKKNYEFKYFFKRGTYFSGKYIEIFVFDGNKRNNKVGFIASKKVGGSVVRNHVKRYMREAFYSIEDKLSSNINLLILWKKNINPEDVSFFEVKEDLYNVLQRADKIKVI